MNNKTKALIPGKILCGLSLALVFSAGAQENAPATDPFGGGAAGTANHDPFASDSAPNDDPFATGYNARIFRKGKADAVLKGQKDQVAVMIEMIEVDHLVANGLMLEFSKKANDAKLMRQQLMELVGKGEAKLSDTLWGRSPMNEVGKIEAIVEKIYATEYEPPELPQFVTSGPGDKKDQVVSAAVEVKGDLYTGATPTAFDTRNTGTAFEFEAAESPEHPGRIGVSIYLSIVKFLQEDQFLVEGFENDARGTANIVMPRFSNISQEFVATVTPGNHTLLGIFKDGADKTESKRVIVLMHLEIIASQ